MVAVDDGIRPQTVEALKAARTANCAVVVALNKIDKLKSEAARTSARRRILTQLTEFDLIAEEFGGDVQVVEVSAMTGEGLDSLREALEDMEATRLQAHARAHTHTHTRGDEVASAKLTALITENAHAMHTHYACIIYEYTRVLHAFRPHYTRRMYLDTRNVHGIRITAQPRCCRGAAQRVTGVQPLVQMAHDGVNKL